MHTSALRAAFATKRGSSAGFITSPRLLCVLIGCLLPALVLAARAEAAPAPAWQLDSVAAPTNFSPADTHEANRYKVIATNIGARPTDGSDISLVDELPSSLTPTGVSLHVAKTDIDVGPFACSTEPHLATCQITGPVKEFLGPIPNGTRIVMTVHVAVESGAAEGPVTNLVHISGGGAQSQSFSSDNEISSSPAPFALRQTAELITESGAPATSAGSRPYALSLQIDLNTQLVRLPGATTIPDGNLFVPSEDPRHITVDLPPGLIGNPLNLKRCEQAQFGRSECPVASRVGTLTLDSELVGTYGIYALKPTPGHAAEFGMHITNVGAVFFGAVRTGEDYGIRTITFPVPELGIRSLQVQIWGVPADASHDVTRGAPECFSPAGCISPMASGAAVKPFLSMPTACSSQSLQIVTSIDSWQRPDQYSSSASSLAPVEGCNAVQFDPKISAKPTTNLADSPSGLDFDLEIPQNEEAQALATSHLRDAAVTLPPGLLVNPASAAGLTGCTESEIGYLPGTRRPEEFTPEPAQCPDSAKIGSVEIDTPLLDHPLPGSVYLAQPRENPFGTLLAIYLAVYDPQSGVVIKLAGKVSPDPQSGQLTTSFEENPQQPVEHFRLHFFKGPLAPLRTPATCGTYTTTSVLTPYSAPESGPPAQPSDSFEIIGGPGGEESPCPESPTAEPHAPAFHAGTENVQAGQFSPFALRLVREDGSQELSKIETTLPPGLTGRLAGVTECSDAQLALAASREHEGGGIEERQSPSCPAASEVGSVEVGAGAGPDPLYVTGRAYLAGPYKGAPLSLAIITPAVAGPFDLGDVVVRTALYVDPTTAQIKAVSDEIPHILQGIPLDVRSVTLKMDRPNFTLNPTNCEEEHFEGAATSVLGQAASLSQRFQVSECAKLPFKPKLALRLKGSPKRAKNPSLTATLTMSPGSANIAAAQVTLPHSSFLDQAHIAKTCGRPELASHTCPAASIYGHATAVTPLLDHPLEGPVYLATGFGYQLPALVADLNGQIEVMLKGKVDSGREDGIRNTFEVVPDAPVSKFTLHMFGGRKSLIENSQYLCSKHAKRTALARFTAQNGKVAVLEPTVANSCKKNHKGHRHKKKHGRSSKGGHRHRPARLPRLLAFLRW